MKTNHNGILNKIVYLMMLTLLGSLNSIASSAYGAGVIAGTLVKNTVEVSYFINDSTDQIETEFASSEFTVDEIINVSVVSLDTPATIVATPDTDAVLSFQITNTGNGDESYRLTLSTLVSGDEFNPTNLKLWLETNGLPGLQSTDTPYLNARASSEVTIDASGHPTLSPDQSIIAYVQGSIPASLLKDDEGHVTLTATSETPGVDSTAVGGTIDNLGDNGTDLVSLVEFGSRSAIGIYKVSPVQLNLQKTILSVVDPIGGNTAISNSRVTYQINIDVVGDNGVIEQVVIQDPTPNHMTYVAGSMFLDGAALSDQLDSDIGDFNRSMDNAITLSLGDVPAPSSHVLTITYTIN